MAEDKKSAIPKISTGIKNLDKITGGGFQYNSTNLIVGNSGAGKSTIAIHFIVAGMREGEKCLYINFEEKKEAFYNNMKLIGFDLEKYEKERKFFFLEYSPEKVRTMLEEGGGIIETLILREKITRVVIDSMTSFGLLFGNDLEKRESLLELFDMLKRWDCTTLLTYEAESSQNRTTPDILELESDSTIMLYLLRNKNKREKYVEVLKMRGAKHSEEIYKFLVTKNGVEVDSDPVKEDIGLKSYLKI